MNIEQNKSFHSVSLYQNEISILEVMNQYHTKHLDKERKKRFDLALKQNKTANGGYAEIDKIFLVDKGHKDGKELHCVTKKGIIFILNEKKYNNHQNSLITILMARPNQVIRLYEAVKLKTPNNIKNFCTYNVKNGFNI